MSLGVSGVFFELDPPRSDKPALAFLRDYWDQKREQRPMPARADINPAEMKKHIRAIVLVEALPDYADFRYRMIGSDVTEHMLGDATGKTVRELLRATGRPRRRGLSAPTLIWRAIASPCVFTAPRHGWIIRIWISTRFICRCRTTVRL